MIVDKDAAIHQLIEMLDLERRGWVIVDNWHEDQCAIGLAHHHERRRLVYVSSFGMQPGQFYYECEVGKTESLEDYETLSAGDVGTFAELLRILERHLGAAA